VRGPALHSARHDPISNEDVNNLEMVPRPIAFEVYIINQDV